MHEIKSNLKKINKNEKIIIMAEQKIKYLEL